VRRMTSLLLTLSALVTASALAAPAAGAAPQTGRQAAVPAGWEAVDGDELAAMGGERSSAAANGAPSAADEPSLIAMQSVRNGNYVAAEVSYAAPHTGVLRARSADVGGWESFAFEWDETTQTYALRSAANGRYVAVEKNFTGSARNVLRARSTGVGGWERFVLYHHEGLDRWALQSTLNGLFVTMENDYTGTLRYVLRARSADITGSWEEFNLYGLDA